MTRRRLLVGVGLVVALVVIVAAWTFWPRGTNEVSEEDAVEDFRERNDAEGDQSAGGVPAPGVYTFRATGGEDVRLGPLPTQHRTLPDTVTAVAVDLGDGCFDWTVNLFEEHTETTRFCVDDGGALALDHHEKHQQIGALSPTASMTCDPATLVDGADLACELDLSGGPASITASLAGTVTAGASTSVTVGEEEVDVVPLTVDYTVSGDLSGSWTETLWLTEDHLPVRIERALDLSGPATFTEDSDLELVDLTPTS